MYTTRKTPAGWDVVAPDGSTVLLDESYGVAENVAYACNTGARGVTECDEVAGSIIMRFGYGVPVS